MWDKANPKDPRVNRCKDFSFGNKHKSIHPKKCTFA